MHMHLYVHKCTHLFMNIFVYLLQRQLSAARQECESKGNKIEGYKAVISQKDEEVQRVFRQLQSCEALLQQQTTKSSPSYESSTCTPKTIPTYELRKEEEIFQATNEVTELRVRLVQMEDEKQEAVRQLEAAQLEKKLQQEIIAELDARTRAAVSHIAVDSLGRF